MATRGPSSLGQTLGRLALSRCYAEVPDHELLGAFLNCRDENAFAALMRRHGPMVLGVCRRVLRHACDAEDAFQATFLVLARKAGTLHDPTRLAGWLHGVAYRTALRARSVLAGRYERERRTPVQTVPDPAVEALWRDLRPVLDDEIERLPEKYRVPVVLCYLQGRTHAQASRMLGWPLGTVATRLARARERLRRRLTRRGIVLAATVAVGAPMLTKTAAAAVPETLVAAALRAAQLSMSQGMILGGVSARVAALAQGGGKVMVGTALKLVAAGVLAVGLLGAGVGLKAYQKLTPEQATLQEKSGRANEPGQADQVKENEDALRFVVEGLQVDAKQNLAWVEGPGAVHIRTRGAVLGDLLERPATLVIRWSKSMYFNGTWFEFAGVVQGEQDTGRFRAEHVQIALGKPISVSPGTAGKEPIPLSAMLLDRNVHLENTIRKGKQIAQCLRLDAPEVSLEYPDRKIKAFGPGELLMFQPVQNRPSEDGKKSAQSKVVRLRFAEQLWAESATGRLTFKGNVDLIRVPADEPDQKPDKASLPAGGLWVTAERVEFTTPRSAEGKMETQGHVMVRGQEFEAVAEKMTTDDTQGLLQLQGTSEKPALLSRTKKGGAPEEFRGRMIHFSPSKGTADGEGAVRLDGK